MGRRTYGGLVASLAIAVLAAVALGGASARGAGTPPTFTNFVAPAPLGRDAGEPSIGSNWKTGNVMYQAGLETLRVNNFDDVAKTATWTSVGSTITSTASLDPILFTDHSTGRTFVSQLSAACTATSRPRRTARSTSRTPTAAARAPSSCRPTTGRRGPCGRCRARRRRTRAIRPWPSA